MFSFHNLHIIILGIIYIIFIGSTSVYGKNFDTATASNQNHSDLSIYNESSILDKWLYPITSLTKTASKILADATKFQDLSKREQAINLLEDVSKKRPNDPVVLYNLANGYQANSKFTKAAELYQLALRKLDIISKPGYVNTTELSVPPSLIENSSEKALLAKIFFNQGNNYYKQEKFIDAVKSYKYSLVAEPNDFNTKRNLELALKKLEQKSSADSQKPKQEKPNQLNKNKDKNNSNEQQGDDSTSQSKNDNQKSKPNSNPDDKKDLPNNPQEQQNKENPDNPTTDQSTSSANPPGSDTSDDKTSISLERAEQILNSYQNRQKKFESFKQYPQRITTDPNYKNW